MLAMRVCVSVYSNTPSLQHSSLQPPHHWRPTAVSLRQCVCVVRLPTALLFPQGDSPPPVLASCPTLLYSYMLVYIRESALPYVMVNDCEGRPPSPAGSGDAFADQCVKILRELGKHTHGL